jgi:pyruvate dehydrogenase E1 component alpha subunit/2-oxoisovalerate dehydrogenase E1 component alpha subunit
MLAMISHLGSNVSVVNGILFARRMRGVTGIVGGACLGDGATSTGASHEALNQAGVEKLPLVVVIANNHYAYSTPNEHQFACRSLVDRAIGYGFEGYAVDGTDLEACLKVVGGAVERARAGGGPQMVVAEFLRLCGHGEHDDASYIDPKFKAENCGRDCLKVAEHEVQGRNWANAETLSIWRNEAAQSIEETIAQVQREAGPDPFKEDWRALASGSLAEGYE